MLDRDQMKVRRLEASAVQQRADSPGLPPAIQSIVAQNWEALRPALEKEELLTALECFSQYVYRQQAVLPGSFFVDEMSGEMIRQLFERSELARRRCATDEEIRYRFELFAGFFKQAFLALNARQRQVVRLSASSAYSAAEISRAMRFASVAKMQTFQRRALRMIVRGLCVILKSELKKPGVEARRLGIIKEWAELFSQRAGVCLAAFLWGMFMPGF